jgi:hypothetical protein
MGLGRTDMRSNVVASHETDSLQMTGVTLVEMTEYYCSTSMEKIQGESGELMLMLLHYCFLQCS